MLNQKGSIKCIILASVFILVTFSSQIHVASLNISDRNVQDPGSNKYISDKDVPPDVEIFKPILKDGEKTQIINTTGTPVDMINSNTESGFDLTKEEMEKFKIWPYGIIPYYIDDFSFDTVFSGRLNTLLNAVNTATGLRFMELTEPPKNDNERWVFFINRRGLLNCEDYTTRSFTNVGVQRVVLGYDCLGGGGSALAATVLALAGVPPQHNAPNRDEHISVIMDNIVPEKRHLFQVLKDDEWLFHDFEYDFLSAGHFDFHKYTLNGSATIVPKEQVTVPVGEGDGISFKDISKIKMLYNFIKRRNPKAKASDCSKLYKPAANFDKFEPADEEVNIKPRNKPEKYLKGAGNDNNSSSTNMLKYNLKKKAKNGKHKKLADTQDFDTDEENARKFR